VRTETLPESIKNLLNLRTLYLGANRLSPLPIWLGDQTQLEELDISANELNSIPEFIGKLQTLLPLISVTRASGKMKATNTLFTILTSR